MKLKIYVEGGGETKNLKTHCRKGFRSFFQQAGIENFTVTACGSRQTAYKDFGIAVKTVDENTLPILLVDSEAPILDENFGKPWVHLKQRDNWDRPNQSDESQAHLMVQCMEAWFMADKEALEKFYGKDFHENSLPKRQDIENIDKKDIFSSLKMAAKQTKKANYDKGAHSFEILKNIAPQKVKDASPWAKRLFQYLENKSVAK